MLDRATPAIVAAALVAGSAFGVATLRQSLADAVHATKAKDDVLALPPPDQLKIATLGYDAAAVDLLWAQTLVEYGLHGHEKRVFNALPTYLDSILALEPDFAPLFRYVDTLVCYRWPVGTEDDARTARRYLERGVAARPYDHHAWRQYGEFLAFLAPSFLKNDEERREWKRDGARALGQSVELGASADRSLSAATILTRSGEQQAAIKFLMRAYAVTDDPQEREKIAQRLQSLQASAVKDTATRDIAYVETRWKNELGFVSRGEWLLLGPTRDPFRCAGLGAPRDCARDWGSQLPSASDEER
jgi:hypothetical protein